MPLKSGLALYKDLGTIINTSTQDSVRKLEGKILSARILNIDQSGSSTNGYATVQILDEIKLNGADIIVGVLPLSPNTKNYPLINETVLIISLANKEYKKNFNTLTFYYLSPINLWNSSQTNPIPYPTDQITPSSQNKGYLEVEAIGIPNQPATSNNTVFNPGNYFVEKTNINPTYPYEGDYIIDGRFGNSIRLGNTVPNGTAPVPNEWSTTGSLGDPITIFSNQKAPYSPSWDSITEQINKDGSSIYLTSTQQIPLQTGGNNSYNSYDVPPTQINKYNQKQIIINSGRLVLNTNQNHLLLSSIKSIGLSAIESVNIDTKKTVINTQDFISGGGVFLGGKEATEPVVKGDTAAFLLEQTLDALINLCIALRFQTNMASPPLPLSQTNNAAADAGSVFAGVKNQLDQIKSKFVKTL
jgi:hypothetical protein